MRYRIKITKDYRGTHYTPQVLTWPSWLGVWNTITSLGHELFYFKDWVCETKGEALKAIEAHKQKQQEGTITYEYID